MTSTVWVWALQEFLPESQATRKSHERHDSPAMPHATTAPAPQAPPLPHACRDIPSETEKVFASPPATASAATSSALAPRSSCSCAGPNLSKPQGEVLLECSSKDGTTRAPPHIENGVILLHGSRKLARRSAGASSMGQTAACSRSSSSSSTQSGTV